MFELMNASKHPARWTALAALLMLGSCASLQDPYGQDPYGTDPVYDESVRADSTAPGADVHFGLRQINMDAMDEVDDQGTFGFTVNNHDPESERPFGLEFSGFISQTSDASDERRIEGSLTELSIGIRRNMRLLGPLVPYAGLGVSALLVEREEWRPTAGPGQQFDSDSELAIGLYVHGGAYFEIGNDARIGFDVRAIPFTSQVELGSGDREEEGIYNYQATIFVGVSL